MTPELPLGLIFQSKASSKFSYLPLVTRSLDILGSGESAPSLTFQPASGAGVLNPFQPAVDLPSNSSVQPPAASAGVSVLSAAGPIAAKAPVAKTASARPSTRLFITVMS